MTKPLDKAEMINEIIFQCQINNVYNIGMIWLSLIFLDEPELRKICQHLHIKTK